MNLKLNQCKIVTDNCNKNEYFVHKFIYYRIMFVDLYFLTDERTLKNNPCYGNKTIEL